MTEQPHHSAQLLTVSTASDLKVPNTDALPGNTLTSIFSPNLTHEQREMYKAVLTKWEPEVRQRKRKKHICKICSKEFKSYQNLYLHTTRTHSTDDAVVMCELCVMTFKNKHQLYTHRMNTHRSPSERRECEFCQQEFRSKLALQIHLKRVHPETLPELKCPTCRREFDMPYKLRNHIKNHEQPSNVNKIKRSRASQIGKCHICNKVYKRVKQHISEQHNDDLKVHGCVFCPQKFKTRKCLKRHVLVVHPPLEARVVCPECHKEFKNQFYLRAHMQLHKDLDKKLECDECHKFFISEKRLRIHKTFVHPTGGRKYPCDACDKAFAHERNLRRHIDQVHTNTDPAHWSYECEECHKRYKTATLLKSHRQRHERRKLKEASRPAQTDELQEIEFVKVEPVTSSESGSGTETETDSDDE